MAKRIVLFEPTGIRIAVDERTTILQAARSTGLHISSECGGHGTCGKCSVVIKPAPDPSERGFEHLLSSQIEEGTRLACQHKCSSNMRIVLTQAMGQIKILSKSIANENAIDVDKGFEGQYGVAIDLGTTTIVAYLLDLGTGIQEGHTASLNPQIVYGEDIVSRLSYVMNRDFGHHDIRESLSRRLDAIIAQMSASIGTEPSNITKLTVVGNTAMHHLFLELDVSSLALAPYRPAMRGSYRTSGQIIGLNSFPNADVYFAPNIAGFVGGDTVAFMLSQRLDLAETIVLGIDIGTNGEIVLSKYGELYCCSAAAGSAFEGSTIKHGMRAQDGAIEYVTISDASRSPDITIIGKSPVKGICGSGIVDLVASLRGAGLVDEDGKMHDGARVEKDDSGMRTYVVVDYGEMGTDRRIEFTQKDVRQVQLAKGAILAGTRILMKEAGVSDSDIKAVFLAGAFGNYINSLSALQIGLLPRVSLEKIVPVGNAAGDGAKRMLLSEEQRRLAEELATSTEYVELASYPGFSEIFLDSTNLYRHDLD